MHLTFIYTAIQYVSSTFWILSTFYFYTSISDSSPLPTSVARLYSLLLYRLHFWNLPDAWPNLSKFDISVCFWQKCPDSGLLISSFYTVSYQYRHLYAIFISVCMDLWIYFLGQERSWNTGAELVACLCQSMSLSCCK